MQHRRFVVKALGLVLLGCAADAQVTAQTVDRSDAVTQILAADRAFARAVADRDRARFLSFLAEVTTFNGGTPAEVRGRDGVLQDWSPFFEADGPTLSWAPSSGQVLGAGDLGYTVGQSVLRRKDAGGRVVERRGEYLTVWRRQPDGSWKVVFDTGSTLQPAR